MTTSEVLQGIAAAPGIAIGPAFRFRAATVAVERRHVADSAAEMARLEEAKTVAHGELEDLQAKVSSGASAEEGAIFEAHQMFLDDPTLFEEIAGMCQAEQCNVEWAVNAVFDQYSAALAANDDEIFQARAADLQDVKRRLLRILSGASEGGNLPDAPCILLAHDLLPSETVTLDRNKVLAFCTAVGGATSHVAILARGLGLPAVVGLGEPMLQLADGTPLVVDGKAGQLHVNPDEQTQAAFRERQASDQQRQTAERVAAQELAVTSDGLRVEVVANVSSEAEAENALVNGAEGVGLLRTELLFVDRPTAPTEEEQLVLYRAIADTLERRPLIIRTLDIGADKPVSYLPQPAEANPALGNRGIRLARTMPELLRTQLRAIWRMGPGYPVKIMFPMVATTDEIRALRQLAAEVEAELRAEGIAVAEQVEIGIMVEVPAIAVQAAAAAPLVDFFSIGTNDLTQYTMAVDRTNAAVSHLSDALNPAVLRLIEMTCNAASAAGKWVGVCGELAGDPLAAPLLVGLGVKELSASPANIPAVKAAVRATSQAQATELARRALACESAAQVRALLRDG
ncbi:MAG: phosphoenolpyruvate--protein phosphotransferase [Chloroflexaceae bacterium]|jgi:phosphoenolpyruvate-protein phosphotransferase|nr:phosphoenolpyruvate--protein phosphotransferase [Chloroflexaceae bacterium]